MTEETPYLFRHGNAESVGRITKRQAELIEAIIDGDIKEYIDEMAAGRNAFPRRSHGDGGMTLRDYFAGQAATGILARGTFLDPAGLFTGNGAPVMAEAAYLLADAMLKERVR